MRWWMTILAAFLASEAAGCPQPTLGMIGGVKAGGGYWQPIDGLGLAHARNPEYRDYSQHFREFTHLRKAGYVHVGYRNGFPVYAAPDDMRGEDGNYRMVSAAEYARIACDLGALIPTRDEVKALFRKATRIPMPTQPIWRTGGPGDPVAYTAAVDKAIAKLQSGAVVVHGKMFYTPH